MKIYIASTLSNYKNVQALRDALIAKGHIITYDWTTHGSVKGQGISKLKETALNEINGVKNADLLIVLQPGGKGTHTEFGIALADNIPVMMYSNHLEDFNPEANTCSFYWHDNVLMLSSDGFSDFLEQIPKAVEQNHFDFYEGRWRR